MATTHASFRRRKPIRCDPAIALHDDVYIKRCLRATIWLLLQPSDEKAISKL